MAYFLVIAANRSNGRATVLVLEEARRSVFSTAHVMAMNDNIRVVWAFDMVFNTIRNDQKFISGYSSTFDERIRVLQKEAL